MDYEIFAMQDKVAIKLKAPEEKVGNILLPDTAKGDNHLGTIVSLGRANTIELAIGDLVVVPRYAGSSVVIDGEELLFMKISDILARLLPIPRGVEAAHAGHD